MGYIYPSVIETSLASQFTCAFIGYPITAADWILTLLAWWWTYTGRLTKAVYNTLLVGLTLLLSTRIVCWQIYISVTDIIQYFLDIYTAFVTSQKCCQEVHIAFSVLISLNYYILETTALKQQVQSLLFIPFQKNYI